MKHVDINKLQSGSSIESVYLLRDVSKKTRKTGEPFVGLNFQDATGIVNAIMWDRADLFLSNQAVVGDFVLIRANVGQYNGKIQLTVREASKVDRNVVELDRFLPASRRPVQEMHQELNALIDRVKRPHLRALLDSFFSEDRYLRSFLRCPSARSMHQAYLGGLVEHTLGVAKNALAIASNYPDVDVELLLTGALLHDGSKVFEYAYDTAITITDRGRLIGHLAMMAIEIEQRVRDIPEFPARDRMLLEHMILAHHGRQEWGAAKKPQTAEALVLFYADYIDAYLSTYFDKCREAREKGENWTGWVDMFESYLYAGNLPEPPPPDSKE